MVGIFRIGNSLYAWILLHSLPRKVPMCEVASRSSKEKVLRYSISDQASLEWRPDASILPLIAPARFRATSLPMMSAPNASTVL